ncbi:hypothetical protein FRC00_006439 [Tulasnella sp. 408]|nr:hypothetical protein FRC00_006439 [Tulasnella sp. 408]
MSIPGGALKPIWQLSPAELEMLRSDVMGYLDGLQVTHIAFILYRCTVLGWVFTVQAALAAITISSILAARLWALYERDRRVLIILILGFVACFVPGWILTFRSGPSSIDPNDLRIFGNVLTYIGGVAMQEGYDALDWRLKKCYHFRLPKVSCSIVIGSLVYESGIFLALLWKMFKDKKKTRIIEAFYRESAFYVAIKSMACSHVILRLRSYFSHGDAVVDGHLVSDPRDDGGKAGGDSTSSSIVSTIIHFAQMISGDGGGTFEIQSKHLTTRRDHPSADRDGAGLEEGRSRSLTSDDQAAHSSPPNRLQQSSDWTDAPDPIIRRSGQIDLPSRSEGVLAIGPSANPLSQRQSKRPRWLRRNSGGPNRAQNEVESNPSSSGALQNVAAARSWEEPLAIIEMEDITGATGGNTRRHE